MFRSKTAILTDQLLGRGCQYQEPGARGSHTVNPFTRFLIRHPDFVCPMWAARHLGTAQEFSKTERESALKAFDEALRLKPESFDTGDGVIEYGREIRAARALVAARD